MSRLKDLFKKSTNESAKTEEINEAQFGSSVPEGLWVKCPKCGAPLVTRIAKLYDLEDNLMLHPKAHCSKCSCHITE